MELTVNGRSVTVPSDLPDVTLLDMVRDYLGLKGTKFGCGVGLCGACTLHLDGAAVRSCQVTVADAANRRITTIEGLADRVSGERLHPVQLAWIEEAVPQCGYCQPGQIMQAAALLERIPSPSDAEIREWMNGNLCRCGTYARIRAAVRRASGKP